MKRVLTATMCFLLLLCVCFAAVNDQANVLTMSQTKELLKTANSQREKTGVEYNFYFINNEGMLAKAKSAASSAPRTVTMVFYKLEDSKMNVSILASNDIDLTQYTSQVNDALNTIKPQLIKKAYLEGAQTLVEDVAKVVESAEKEKKISKVSQSHIGGRIIGIEILEWVLGLIIVIILIMVIKRYFKTRHSTQCKYCKVPMHMTKGDFNDTSVSREYECKICGYTKKFNKK